MEREDERVGAASPEEEVGAAGSKDEGVKVANPEVEGVGAASSKDEGAGAASSKEEQEGAEGAGAESEAPKVSLWSAIQSVLAAAVGVQSEASRERDMMHHNPFIFIILGIIFTALFMATVGVVVYLVLPD